eukprot:TRINITY_DN10067_c0_g1_i1.p1 TRINITY_DN10067_c0_g1~~TRINITY_DN10067_c0_g1_i1.p1  ORF type:complete len:163 (-),score=28.25 TRINITY_DN10067_c0_g1_i1:110-598(-)
MTQTNLQPFYLLPRAEPVLTTEVDLIKHFSLLDGRSYDERTRKKMSGLFLELINPALTGNLKNRHFRPRSKGHRKKDTGLKKLASTTKVPAVTQILPFDPITLRRAFTLLPGPLPKHKPKKSKTQPAQQPLQPILPLQHSLPEMAQMQNFSIAIKREDHKFG